MFHLDSPQFVELCERKFHPGTRAKGLEIHASGRVFSCEVHQDGSECDIFASVQGSSGSPYEVEITCGRQNGTVFLDALCTCPVVEHCKHIYAVLLKVKEEQKVDLRTAPSLSSGNIIALPPPLPEAKLSSEWQAWLDRVGKSSPSEKEEAAAPGDTPEQSYRLFYVIKPAKSRQAVTVEFFRGRLAPNGAVKSKSQLYLGNILNAVGSDCVSSPDRILARKIYLSQVDGQFFSTELSGKAITELLPEILATGRCYWKSVSNKGRAVALGPARAAAPVWRMDARGWQQPAFDVAPEAAILPLSPPWYVDEKEGLCGPLETGLPPDVAAEWLFAPKIAPEQSHLVWQQLPERQIAGLPLPAKIEIEIMAAAPPVPCLRLSTTQRPQSYTYFDRVEPEAMHLAHLEFDYAGVRVSPRSPQPLCDQFENNRVRRLTRDLNAERAVLRVMDQMGFDRASAIYYLPSLRTTDDWSFYEEGEWLTFVFERLPKLQEQGWRIETEPNFAFRMAQPEEWYADAQAESGADWFNAEVGVQLDGQKVNLLPILMDFFAERKDLFGASAISQLSENGLFLVPLPDGRRLPFPVPRLKVMLNVLLDLFEPQALDENGKIRLTRLRAAELSGTAGAGSWRWLGGDGLRQLSDKLRDFRSIRTVVPPQGLQARLRGYQEEGLNWLQFLRDYNLGGILADDMGLGKTVQALAHVLEEKNSGRADRPSLVVAPTSLMTNWRQETERFAPSLKLLVLHGQDRKANFDKLRDFDLIVTSYPLLPRDEAVLLKEEFHLVILDEAQYIKNPKTRYAQIVCQLRARHPLCLTGTPMENHLGELWSQFNFLLPGFLGDEVRFRKLFRNPIEKGGDTARREILARRIAPFVLRRRKEQVAAELPPKTEILQNVELSGAQRDLYETIRLSMHARVQAEVRQKGLSRAHIIILDALLKLRQVCCDPRLVKLPAARAVNESAKLELLMDLVPEMLAEGRHILLFSQFTSMLELIQAELAKQSIPYVLLTGDTTDRATPIERFQNGQVPLFLISLKAGGTGLNLTAADTVIHYDPWWNPAVENQATDRAHRIGQTKSVFVYKLITAGTVEEKILALQARKRDLVEGLMNESHKEVPQLTQDDLQVLFAPLG
ncbi:MAG: SNF2-related protein [Limisphaerales bacterium]